jgi:1-acyl-sn-glycerol-3-phosphate acyltransferase
MREKVKFRRPLIYKFLYNYVSVFHRLYYRRITVVGYEKIPTDTPLIFAPNHQNALMDALAVDFASKRALVFLARADIFKKPAIAKLLNMLRILPIYRIRDGFEALGNNQEVFDNTVDVLKSNIPLCILPEGNHEGHKRLRPLKKGIFRIALQAEESSSFNLNLQIIPVGIDYSNYFNAGSDLTVVFGTPIKIADYASQYKENEQRTINKLMHELAENMRSVMIHIPEEHYELTSQISEMFEPNVWNTCNVKRHPYNKLTIRQYIVQKATKAFVQHPEKTLELGHLLDTYNVKLSKFKLKDCILQQRPPHLLTLFIETLLCIFLLPLHVYGLISNYIPFKIPIMIASKVKDKHFRSSIQFGIGLFLFPIYYLILIVVFCLLTENFSLKVIFALSLPLTGFFAFYNYQFMRKLCGKLRLFSLRFMNSDQYNALQNERNQIIDLIKATINS